MSIPQEHDYIGLSEKFSDKNEKNCSVLNLKETELRLGLPGSESPDRKTGTEFSLFGKDLKDETKNGFSVSQKNFVSSGAKRGFSDAINGCNNWGLGIKGGSEAGLVKSDVLFCPREVSNSVGVGKSNKNLTSVFAGTCLKTVELEQNKNDHASASSASKAQVVGWPPVRSFRKNNLATNSSKNTDVTGKSGCLYVKVSMDGAPYLRKIDLNTYNNYAELSSALEKMFSCFTLGKYGHGLAGQESLSESRLIDILHGSEYVLTYEDKDGDWMLVGDVPWEMFTDSCKRLRIMKGSDAIGLAPRTMQKCKSQN